MDGLRYLPLSLCGARDDVMKKQRAAGSASIATFLDVIAVLFAPEGGRSLYVDLQSTLTLVCVCKVARNTLLEWLDAVAADISLGKETRPVPVQFPSTNVYVKLHTAAKSLAFTYLRSIQLSVSIGDKQHKLPPDLVSKQQDDDRTRRLLRGRQVGIFVAQCSSRDKGWGAFAAQQIEPGEFLGEYTGELVSTRQMQRRYQELYDPHKLNYVLSLREHVAQRGNSAFDVVRTNVDATTSGCWTRLLNHSCAPNAEVAAVRVDSFIPRLALFALTRIEAGQEVTFDYGGGSATNTGGRPCCCGARGCRGFLPSNA